MYDDPEVVSTFVLSSGRIWRKAFCETSLGSMSQLFLRSYLVSLLHCRFLFPSRKPMKRALKEGEGTFIIEVFTQLGRPCAYVAVHGCTDSRPT